MGAIFKANANQIIAKVDYETKIFNNHLNKIDENSMDYQETQYDMSIIVDSMEATMTTMQREGENLAD